MPPPIRRPPLVGCLVLALASLALVACGGSSKPSNAAATTTGPGGARFAALRTCLAKSGINLPQRTPGQRPQGTGTGGGGAGRGIFGGGAAGAAGGGRARQLPPGVSAAQYQAAIAKCGGAGFGRGAGAGPGAARFSTPAAKAALTKFAACMKQNGIVLPAPNTTGRGPLFNTAKLNTTSATFKAAEIKCTPLLPTGLGRRPGTPAAAGTTTTGAS